MSVSCLSGYPADTCDLAACQVRYECTHIESCELLIEGVFGHYLVYAHDIEGNFKLITDYRAIPLIM